ncbi:MAG: hypothetical protein M1831_003816 [Alyxoria varia]|nr:MAG: hypothetical protein M1831_003816 [Alyxoria varia]
MMSPPWQLLFVSLALIASTAAFPTTSLAKRISAPQSDGVVSKKFKKYYAAGDSYSAGPGETGDDVEGPSFPGWDPIIRHSGAWPKTLQKALGIPDEDFTFGSCGMFKNKEIRELQIQGEAFGEPDLVSLTLGGNEDNAFMRVMMACAQSMPSYGDKNCGDALNSADSMVEGVEEDIYETIKLAGTQNNVDGASTRTVLVMGYPVTYNYDVAKAPGCLIDPGDRKRIAELGNNLNAKISSAVDRANQDGQAAPGMVGPKAQFEVKFVDPNHGDGGFDNHRLCDNAPWISGQIAVSLMDRREGQFWKGIYHPNYDGHQGMAKLAQNVVSQIPAEVI